MLWLEILCLAILQGIAEFLPISSSGHLVIGMALFDQFGHPITEKLTISIVLHLGTLLAILAFYWRRIWSLLRQDRRVIGLLAVGSVPAALVGVGLKVFAPEAIELSLEGVLENPMTAGLMLPLTGLMLLWTARHQSGEALYRDLSYRGAFVIGLFQAFAILPGISRSGATIVAGLGMRLRRDEAAAFSFLLAIPVIGGAGLIEVAKLVKQASEGNSIGTPGVMLVVGAMVSFVVGLASLWWLVQWIQHGRLYRFAYWVIPLGVAVVIWQLVG